MNDTCVICGAYIPEGYGMVCQGCQAAHTTKGGPIVIVPLTALMTMWRQQNRLSVIAAAKLCGCMNTAWEDWEGGELPTDVWRQRILDVITGESKEARERGNGPEEVADV